MSAKLWPGASKPKETQTKLDAWATRQYSQVPAVTFSESVGCGAFRF